MYLESIIKGAPCSLAAALVVACAIGLAVYRLYFHPLAGFPGPRLAAVSTVYEAYYDIVLQGQYWKKVSSLHDQYGETTDGSVHLPVHTAF